MGKLGVLRIEHNINSYTSLSHFRVKNLARLVRLQFTRPSVLRKYVFPLIIVWKKKTPKRNIWKCSESVGASIYRPYSFSRKLSISNFGQQLLNVRTIIISQSPFKNETLGPDRAKCERCSLFFFFFFPIDKITRLSIAGRRFVLRHCGLAKKKKKNLSNKISILVEWGRLSRIGVHYCRIIPDSSRITVVVQY